MKKKITIIMVLMTLIISGLFCIFIMTRETVVPYSKDDIYQIYPLPKNIEYLDGAMKIKQNINVVCDEAIDLPTKKRIEEIFEAKGISVSFSDKVRKNSTNVLLGIMDAGGYVDSYVRDKYELTSTNINNYDSYQLLIKDGNIAVLGVDTDAVFYGVTSLKLILDQIEGMIVRNLVINDYADVVTRGFIEGFYGIPWTNDNRASLMRFGSNFKMTTYIFAPKDDPYHTSKWRELYPESKLNEIAELVQIGIDTKVHFVWTAHPFMGGFSEKKYKEETKKLIAKFEQLYSIGVKQFGVLGDDVGNLDLNIVAYVMNEVSAWGIDKGDVEDFVFCPAQYNDRNASYYDYKELNFYDSKFPDNVQIFWTGDMVLAPISAKTLANFRTKMTAKGIDERRAPLFWLNWPVNDYKLTTLAMGEGNHLHSDLDPKDLAGVLTNPMQEAEASKVGLFAVADYSWNIANFDAHSSWMNSFKYIDADVKDALLILSYHMSSTMRKDFVLDESQYLIEYFETFKSKLANKEDIRDISREIIAEMELIARMVSTFLSDCQNEALVNELEPFVLSLSDLANAINHYVKATVYLENGNEKKASESYKLASSYFANSKTYQRVSLKGKIYAAPGSKQLKPFANYLIKNIEKEINAIDKRDGDSK